MLLRTLVCVGLLRALTPGVFAQVVTPPAPAKNDDPAVQAQKLERFRLAMANAKALATANNVAAAEQEMVAANETKPNTASWHVESAQKLIQLAESLARAARPASVPALANRALLHLNQADALARDARSKAAAKSLAAFVQERYLADRNAALANYRAAAQLAPADPRAKEAVDRLQRTDDNLRTKLPGGGR